MNYLPQRPLTLQRSFVVRSYAWGTLWIVVGLAIAIAYLGWQFNSASRIMRENEVWEQGIAAVNGTASGTIRSHYGIFKEYTLDVAYVDQAGGSHRDHFSFDTFGGGVDDDEQPTVRYDSAHPETYAISWAVECTKSRWASIGFMSIIGALIGIGIVWLGTLVIGRARTTMRVAKSSEEVECRLISAVEQYANGQPTGNINYTFAVPPLAPLANDAANYRDAAVKPETATDAVHRSAMLRKKDGEPFYTRRGPDGDYLLVLVSRDTKEFVLVRNDLYPFELNDSERFSIQTRAA